MNKNKMATAAWYYYHTVQGLEVMPSFRITALDDINRAAAETMKNDSSEGEGCKVTTSSNQFRFTSRLIN